MLNNQYTNFIFKKKIQIFENDICFNERSEKLYNFLKIECPLFIYII